VTWAAASCSREEAQLSDLPNTVHLVEVGPRDGLQIEKAILSVDDKLRLIEAAVASGIREIEVGSFVRPGAVPQMADTEGVVERLPLRPDVLYRGLWLNEKGFRRALAAGRLAIDGRLVVTPSDAFARRNMNTGSADLLAQIPHWIASYRHQDIAVTGLAIQAAFGCNFEGDNAASRVVALVERVAGVLAEHGEVLSRVVLADTMGWANPLQVRRLVGALRERWPDLGIKLHLHDTRGLALANALAGMEMGVSTFDSSFGGLGGCPFAGNAGAAGNICTEDLVFMCDEIGTETGIDLEAAIATAYLAEELVGHELPGKVMRGGGLARRRAAAPG
jgi:hydroxymethylglutaryl-CoA lyase